MRKLINQKHYQKIIDLVNQSETIPDQYVDLTYYTLLRVDLSVQEKQQKLYHLLGKIEEYIDTSSLEDVYDILGLSGEQPMILKHCVADGYRRRIVETGLITPGKTDHWVGKVLSDRQRKVSEQIADLVKRLSVECGVDPKILYLCDRINQSTDVPFQTLWSCQGHIVHTIKDQEITDKKCLSPYLVLIPKPDATKGEVLEYLHRISTDKDPGVTIPHQTIIRIAQCGTPLIYGVSHKVWGISVHVLPILGHVLSEDDMAEVRDWMDEILL